MMNEKREHQLAFKREEGRAEAIKTMYKNGFDIETIAKALSLDIDYVKEIVSK